MDVAENINISKNYLCDIFKKELGVTFINYVTNLRIEKAKEYLTGTDMKMYEVSNAVGYNDYAYFSQIFKKHTGRHSPVIARKVISVGILMLSETECRLKLYSTGANR